MPVISLTNPVNWGHPLNYKRSLWWKYLPSGPRAFMPDLVGGCGLTRGAFANGAKPTGGSSNHGIWSSVALDGTNDYVTSMTSVLTTIGAANISMTAAFWVNTAAATSNPDLFEKCTSGTARAFQFYFDTSTNNCYFLQYNGSVVPYARTVAGGLSAIRDGKWHRIVGVRDCANSVMKIYVDGVDATSASANINFSTDFSNAGAVEFGNNRVAAYYNGRFDDATIWNGRVLTASDVWMDYDLGRRGYPGVLNRVAPTSYFIQPSVTGNWHYYQSQHSLMGAA